MAPPGSENIPLTIGAYAFSITIISAIAAFSARETFRVHLNDLGDPGAAPLSQDDYERMRVQSAAGAKAGQFSSSSEARAHGR
jgi:hypothetical protein